MKNAKSLIGKLQVQIAEKYDSFLDGLDSWNGMKRRLLFLIGYGMFFSVHTHRWKIDGRIIDNHHLTEHGVRYFCALSKEFVLVTSNTDHPAFQVDEDNLHIIYQRELSLTDALVK